MEEKQKILVLPIKRKWFDMIRKGIKLEEYRERKPYYETRLMNAFGCVIVGNQVVHGENVPAEIRTEWPAPVIFRNGYSRKSPEIMCYCNLSIGEGKEEWGAEPEKKYFVLSIEEIRERRRCSWDMCR